MSENGSYDLEKIRELRDHYRGDLLNNTLNFWLRFGVDREFGGIMTCLNREGEVFDTDKGIWQQARFCWLLGELYNQVDSRPEWLDVAEATMSFIDSFGFDSGDGRMWFQVTRDGLPLRKRRYAFSESFASIAYGELAKATGKESYRDKAITCFSAFIKQMTDPVDPAPKWTKIRPSRGLGLPMITLNTAQELRESIGWEEADHWIDTSIDSIQRFHLDHERQCVLETVTPEGDFIAHSDGRTLNPGHAIEGAWFVLWEALHRQDRKLLDLGCQMLDWMWEKGWDSSYGGLLYFVDAGGGQVTEYWHDMKFWWPQNEAIIATLLAFVLTGNKRYAKWHSEIHQWAHQWFPDPEYGEWYGYLHRDGRLSHSLKGTLWKGPFHLPRMQLMGWKLLDRFEENGMKPLMD